MELEFEILNGVCLDVAAMLGDDDDDISAVGVAIGKHIVASRRFFPVSQTLIIFLVGCCSHPRLERFIR